MTLSERQLSIMRMVASGMTDKEIGGKLGISAQTVKNTLIVIYEKLEARNRANAVAITFVINKVPLESLDPVDSVDEPAERPRPVQPARKADDTKPLLSSTEAAKFLSVHPNTVRRWADEGILKCVYIGPRKDRRFWSYELVRFARPTE